MEWYEEVERKVRNMYEGGWTEEWNQELKEEAARRLYDGYRADNEALGEDSWTREMNNLLNSFEGKNIKEGGK